MGLKDADPWHSSMLLIITKAFENKEVTLIMKSKGEDNGYFRVSAYGEFLVLLQCCTDEHVLELMEQLSYAEKPSTICGHEVPGDLNMISYGMLDDFSRISANEDPAAQILKIMFDVDYVDVCEANVFDVFGFLNFVKREIERINKLFKSIKVSFSSEEIAAGVESLDFGTFGVVDWYSRRMGITNQDEVYDIGWIRIFTCMKNDNEKSEYEARLHKQYLAKAKRK